MSVTNLTQAIDRLNHDVVVTDANYGATGNGTTNDIAALEAAIAARSSTPSGIIGGDVFLPKGTYLIDRPLYVPTKIRLVGAGEGTCIKASSTFQGNSLRNR